MSRMTKHVLFVAACAGLAAAAGCGGPGALKMDPTRAYMDAKIALLQAAEDPAPEVRSGALEALASVMGRDAGEVLTQALQDDFAPVLFAAAMGVGDTRHLPAKPALLAMAKDKRTPSKVRGAVIYALHNLGDDQYTGELIDLLRDRQDKSVRVTAAMIMGRIGEPSATGPLESLQAEDRDPDVQLAAVEALATLRVRRYQVILEAFLNSQYMEDRIVAAQALGRLGRTSSARALRRLYYDRHVHPAVRVAAAGSLAQLGEPGGYPLAIRSATKPADVLKRARGRGARITTNEVLSLQMIAIEALGHMKATAAVDDLHPLLRGPEGRVRVAAARTIMRLLRAYGRAARVEAKVRRATRTRPAGAPTTRRLHTSGGKD